LKESSPRLPESTGAEWGMINERSGKMGRILGRGPTYSDWSQFGRGDGHLRRSWPLEGEKEKKGFQRNSYPQAPTAMSSGDVKVRKVERWLNWHTGNSHDVALDSSAIGKKGREK